MQETHRPVCRFTPPDRATLEATTDGILVADGHGRVTSFNERFLEIWNIPREIGRAGWRRPCWKSP